METFKRNKLFGIAAYTHTGVLSEEWLKASTFLKV